MKHYMLKFCLESKFSRIATLIFKTKTKSNGARIMPPNDKINYILGGPKVGIQYSIYCILTFGPPCMYSVGHNNIFIVLMATSFGHYGHHQPNAIIIIIIIIIIIKSFYSLQSIRHPWRASKRCDLQLSPWPRSMIFLCFLFHPLLSFAMCSSVYLFFCTPEDSNLMRFSLLLLLLYVTCVQSNSIFFFLSAFLLASVWLKKKKPNAIQNFKRLVH